jgi:5-methylcytosine-specific restriction endonuclease McrA
MAKAKKTIKKCVLCLSQFKGSIDPEGLFCSTRCWTMDALEPKLRFLRDLARAKKKTGVEYPFFCKSCNKPVRLQHSGMNARSHRKGFCCKICIITYEKKMNPNYRPPKRKARRPNKSRPISFYETREWLELRYRVLRKHGRKCMLCERTDGEIHVDHIKPRSKYPHLQLAFDNLQVLCKDCNLGKSNKDETDFRPKNPLVQIWEEFKKDLKS